MIFKLLSAAANPFGFILSRFSFFRRQLAGSLGRSLNLVKMGAYAKLLLILGGRHPGDVGHLAAAVLSHWFSQSMVNEKGERFVAENRAIIEAESERILNQDPELREIIIQALRIDLVRRFNVKDDFLEQSHKYEKILLKYGGDYPKALDPVEFRKLAERFYDKYERTYKRRTSSKDVIKDQ